MVPVIVIGLVFSSFSGTEAVVIQISNQDTSTGSSSDDTTIDFTIEVNEPSTVDFPNGVDSETLPSNLIIRIIVDPDTINEIVTLYDINGNSLDDTDPQIISNIIFNGIESSSSNDGALGYGNFYGYSYGFGQLGDGTNVYGLTSTGFGEDKIGLYTINLDTASLSDGQHGLRIDVLDKSDDTEFFSSGAITITNVDIAPDTAPTPLISTTTSPTFLELIPFTVNFGEEIKIIQLAAATSHTSITDSIAPTPAIATTAADPTNLEIIPFTVDFVENMTSGEFVAAEIMLSSGTVTDFTPDSANRLFAFNATSADDGEDLTVDVAANVATDLASNNNTAADQLSITVDRTAPTPVIATTAADPTNLEIIPFTVNFGENMTPGEFVAAEITLSSGTVTDFTPDSANQLFAFNVTSADDGEDLTVDVAANVATDLASNNNTAADQLSITVDRTAPTPVIATTAADPTNLEIIPFTVDFDESMTPGEFVAAEITLSSGTVTDFTPDSANQLFAFNVTSADDGEDLTVDVAASVATDLASNNNDAADQLSITVDRTAPTPVIATTAADPTNLESIPFTVDFDESMTPDEFTAAEITLSSGNVIDFTPDSANQLFAFNVTSADDGEDLTVDVAASVATDLASNNNDAADQLSITVDRTAPTPVIATTAADPTNLEIIPFTVDFDESMTPDEFTAAEITLSSGNVIDFTPDSANQLFAFNVTSADDGEDLTVDVAASVATDLASNNNDAADQLSITVDRTAPTPVIATTAADPTNLEIIPFTVDFDESMTPDEFTAAEITLSSGTVTGFGTSDDQEFAFNVIEADEGVLTVDVAASVATDLASNNNDAADQLSITVDRTAPTPVIATTAADPTNLESIPFTVDFDESMTPDEFTAAEITLSSGNVIDFTPDSANQLFAFNVTSADDGEDLTVDVAASVATDLASNNNDAADQLSITVDRTAPTPVIATTAADPTNLESIPFTVDFDESMTPDEFTAAEITLSSGNVIDFTPDSANQLFAFNVTSADDGEDLTVDVPASVATDLASNNNDAADQLSITVDRTAPTPVIATTAADPTNLESIPFTVDFDESMTPDEFTAAEITLSSGTVTGFGTSDDQEFAFNVIEADEGVLTVDVPASVATDLASNNNDAADQLSITVDRTAPTPVIATTAADPTNLEIIPFTVDFDESMTPDEFTAAEITLSSGNVIDFTPDSANQLFAFNVTSADDGEDLTVDVAASVATDLASNNNDAADQLSITVDRTAPTPVIATTAADPTNLESIPFTVDFDESMTPDEFTAAEITLSSGTVTGFGTSDDQEFAFNVIEADEGVLTVDVPASVATDLASNNNDAADQLSITVDRTAPTPVIATTAADPTNLEIIPFTVDFDESMTPDEFTAAEITLSSGNVIDFTPDSANQLFAFNVTSADDGEDLTVDVAASVATDLASNNNDAADQLSITVDRTAPTPVIATTAADPTNLEIIPFTVDFDESMTPDEFTAAEITLSSGTVTGFGTSDDQEFAFNVIEADEGVLTVDVPASVATDLASNNNDAADQLSITVDRTAPTPVIATTAADPTNLESIPFTVDFDESMTPDEFTAAEITLSSGNVIDFTPDSANQLFAFNVTSADDGEDLTVDVAASVATDLASNNNVAADQLSITVDRTAPTPVIATTAADPTNLEIIPFTVNFGESMTPDEFVAAEITLSSGTVTGFGTSDDQEFAFNVIEADEGVLTVDVAASVATDLASNNNDAADQLSITVDRTAPTPVIATTAADPTNLESIPFTVDFDESMTPDEFTAAEITLSSGNVIDFTPDSANQLFAFNVTSADDGEDLTVDVAASVATDLASNNNDAADQLSITVDRTAPTPVIATTAADPTNLEIIPFTVDFDESMTPDEFTAAEITLSSGNVIDFTPDSANQLFAFNVTSADDGEDLTVDVAASVATDLASNNNDAADQLSITVDVYCEILAIICAGNVKCE